MASTQARALHRSTETRLRRRQRPQSRRLGFEWLEQRLVMNGDPINLGTDTDNQIQIQLSSANSQWTIDNGIYKSNTPVLIGFKPSAASFIPMMVVGDELQTDGGFGILIDPTNNKFTIKASPTDHNVLSYLPNKLASKLANLFEFVGDYTILADTLIAAGGITPSGLVLATDPDSTIGVNVDNGGTLNPSSVQLTKATDLKKTPELVMTGSMSIDAASKYSPLKQLLKKLHMDIGNSASANVTADATGLVTLVSQTGSAIFVQISPGSTFDLGPVQVSAKQAFISYDLTAKKLSISGTFTFGLGDDGSDQTPFLFDFGDRNKPGLVLDFNNGFQVDSVYLAVQAGQNNGQTRSSINLAGMSLSVANLFFLYDRSLDEIGFGGQINLSWGEKADSGASAQATLLIGSATSDPATSRAGMFVKDGKVDSFSGELKGTFKLRRVTIQADVNAKYSAAVVAPSTTGTASIWGTITLLINDPLNQQQFAMTATLPTNEPLIYTSGDWILQGINIAISGELDAPGGLDIKAAKLSIGFGNQPNPTNPSKTDFVVTVSGGVVLPKLWNATLTFNDAGNPGLVIVNGDIQLNGFQFSLNDISIGGAIGLKAISVNYEKRNDGKDWDLKVAGKVVLPGGIELDGSIELFDGKPISLGVEYKATGADPGIPLGDTGLFITDAGIQLENLYSAEIVVEGEIGLGYGEPIDGVRAFDASGHFKVDRHEFDIVSAQFEFLGGQAGKGKGSLELNWDKHEYKANFDVQLFYEVLDISGAFELNPFGQVTVFLDAGVRIPSWVPFVGGLHLADLDGLFYYDPIDTDNTVAAAWIDINLFIVHLRAGLEYVPNGPNEGLHWISGSQVTDLENQAQNNGSGYTTSFTTAINTNANQSLFTIVSDTANAVGTVNMTVPGLAAPVVLTGDATQPVAFTVNNFKYQAIAVNLASAGGSPNPASKHSFSWNVVADPTANPFAYLPQGTYSITTLTAEPLESKLTHKESFSVPQVSNVVVAQASNSNSATITLKYGTGDPNATTIDLFYTTDASATTGTRFQSISLAGLSNTGSATGTLDLSPLAIRRGYYILARISDPTNPAVAPSISSTTVTPYPTVTAQLAITPNIPLDHQADTLSGWPVTWHRTDVSVPDIRTSTDSFGFSGLAVATGTWVVTVAPANWDGFNPVAGPGQVANPNGQLIQAGVATGVPGNPTSLSMGFRNMISVHGLISEDLSGDGKFQPGGAGLSSLVVYVDLNNNQQLDDTDPRTMTDLGGYYDLRFPLPAVAANYTIRLVGSGAAATYLRVDPGDATNDAYRLAVPITSDFYPIAVDPLKPDPQEGFTYNGRDFLLDHPIIISGVAYVSGLHEGTYKPGAAPAIGKKIDLRGITDPTIFLTTDSAADGSYSFVVPKPGQYTVSTDINDFMEVNAPGRHAFGTSTVNGSLDYSVSVKTPGGGTLYQLGDGLDGPLTASGDFFGDGMANMATLAVDAADWSATKPANLYVVVYQGSDLPSKVTAKAYLVASALPRTPSLVPSLSWSGSLDQFVLTTPSPNQGVIAYALDPATGLITTAAIPANAVVPAQGVRTAPAPMTTLLGSISSMTNETDAWLMASSSGREWMLLGFDSLTDTPEILASYDFFTSNGVRPDLSRHADASGNIEGRWAALTQGEFDGDGIPDYAFSAVNDRGDQLLAYLLSKENYSSVHTLLLGGSFQRSANTASSEQVFINSVSAIPPTTMAMTSGIDSIAIHRSAIIGSGPTATLLNDMLIFAPSPSSNSQVLAGGQSGTFVYQSNFPLAGGFSDDMVTDINADNYPDLLILDDQVLGVILSMGNGQFAAPIYSSLQSQLMAGASGGLLSAGTFPAPVPCNALPSILYVQQSAAGQALKLQLVFNSSTFSNSYVFDVQSTGSYGGYNFGFASSTGTPADTITGSVFVDLNANGLQDPGEPNLVNRTVQVVTYDPLGLPDGVTNYQTGPDGRFSIPASATQMDISVPGLSPKNTVPTNAGASYEIDGESSVTGYDFGVQYSVRPTATLQGIVYLSSKSDGSYTPGDLPLAGITVYVDLNGTGKLDAGDKKDVTDDHGAYQITGLGTGTYVVLQDLPAGVRQLSAPVSVDAIAGQTTYAVNFGDSKSNETLDFNLDGRPDYIRLVPHGPTEVEVVLDTMASGGVGASRTVGTFDPSVRRPVGLGDFNRDGHLDLLFQDQVGGGLHFWELNYGEFVSDEPYGEVPKGFRVIDVIDFSQLGPRDLLVENVETGVLDVLVKNPLGISQPVRLGSLASYEVLEGFVDADGDRDIDMLIRDTRTGNVTARLLEHGITTGQLLIGTLPPGYHLAGVDPRPAGNSFLYWQNDQDGSMTRWNFEPGAGLVEIQANNSIARATLAGRYLSRRDAFTPLIESVPDQSVTAGSTVSISLLSNPAAENRVLRYRLEPGAPQGATIDPITGQFSWNVARNTATGVYTIAIRAVDPSDLTYQDSREFRVTVTAVSDTTTYVDSIYQIILHRPATEAELRTWVKLLDDGVPRPPVVQAILDSPEHRGLQVDEIYQRYLHRLPTTAERASMIASFLQGNEEVGQIKAIVATPEYARLHPTVRSTIIGLFQEVLGRGPTRGELATWTRNLQRRAATRRSMASALYGSRDASIQFIVNIYATDLGRAPTKPELTSWVHSLRSRRLTREGISRAILASEEFFQRARLGGMSL